MEKTRTTLVILAVIIAVFFTYDSFAEDKDQNQKNQTHIVKDISPEEAHALIEKNKDNPNFVILDVRTPNEFSEEHIENAINIDFYSETFRDDVSKLDKDKTYLTHCRLGGRSSMALDIMKELGFNEAYNMGGIIQWKEKGFPTTK